MPLTDTDSPPADLDDALAAIDALNNDPVEERPKPSPKVKRTRSSTRKPSPTNRTPINKLEEGVTNLYCYIGIGLLPFSMQDAALFVTLDPTNPADAIQPTEASKKAAASLIHLSEQSPRIRRFLESLSRGGAWTEVTMAHAPIVMALLANHGINPLELLMSKRGGENAEEPVIVPSDENSQPSPGPIRLVDASDGLDWRDVGENDFSPVP